MFNWKILFRPAKRLVQRYLTLKDVQRLKAFDRDTRGQKRIFYLGRSENNNLGDNAQHLCIKNWIQENYPDHVVHLTAARHIARWGGDWIRVFSKLFNPQTDWIIFQSGYCTHDFGGAHPAMHELICKTLPRARILMMPQTIFFQHEENRQRVAENHNKARNMLFLARDKVSYEQALLMFPNLRVMLFPDIVTTLIGKYHFETRRDRIFLCCRNDAERFYEQEKIDWLRSKLELLAPVDYGDTRSSLTGTELRKVLEQAVREEIEAMSHYKVVITDRYHGTIFALCAETPVVVLKTTDHKVTTGAEWFKGIYDGYVTVAEDIDHAFQLAKNICSGFEYKHLKPYFYENYYAKLKDYFEQS